MTSTAITSQQIDEEAVEMKSYEKLRQCIKKQKHHFSNIVLSSQSYDFSISHVRMWELNHKESWGPKNWCFPIVVLKKTLGSPLDSKETKPINPKWNQPWIFIGKTDAELNFQYFGHLMWRADSLEKTLMLGKIKGRRRGRQSMRWVDGITDLKDICLSKLQKLWWTGKPGVLQSVGMQRVRHNFSTELQQQQQHVLQVDYLVSCNLAVGWRCLMAVQDLGNADSGVMLWWAANRSFGISIFFNMRLELFHISKAVRVDIYL